MIQTKKLGDIAEIIIGARISRYNHGNTSKQKVLKRNDENAIKLDYEEMDISVDLNEKFFSKRNDILILLAGSNNIIMLEKEGYIIPMFYAIIRVKEGFNPYVLYHLLKFEIFPREINKLVEGNTLKVIKSHHLKEIKIPIFDNNKQEDYGKLFELMDKRINLMKETILLEKNIQKSLINQLMGGK